MTDEEGGELYAELQGAQFCALYRARIDALITAYPDARAREELDDLRDLFWSRYWLKPEPKE